MLKKKRILIVDDSYEKLKVVAEIVNKIPDVELDSCASSRDAIKMMKATQYQILLVDLQIPSFLGGELSPSEGRNLVEYVTINEYLYKPIYIIGITSHIEAFNSCQEYFEEHGWHLILGSDNVKRIEKLITTQLTHTPKEGGSFDIGIITALRKTELEAVLELPFEWERINYADDPSIYYAGRIYLENGDLKSVIATSCPRMGSASAAATTMKVCALFSPTLLIMPGIAAGVQGKVELGDILIADPCWDWGSGKKTIHNGQALFKSAPHQLSLDNKFRSYFLEVATTRKHLDRISDSWNGSLPKSKRLNAHVGPIATGSVVLEDPETVETIISQHRETIGIEMEGYGFLLACSMTNYDRPRAILIKSVCDYADPDKNDDWQAYAAFTSTQLAKYFIYDLYNS